MGKRLTREEVVKRASVVHNNKYHYNGQYVNTNTKWVVTCPIHGDWLVKPINHISERRGCPSCANVAKFKSHDTFIDEFAQMWGDRYRVMGEYTHVHTKIPILCESHGIFNATPSNLLAGSACPSCAIESMKCEHAHVVFRANHIHKNKYIYNDVYKGMHTKWLVTCPVHGEWSVKPTDHIGGGTACPACVSYGYSQTATDVISYISGLIGVAFQHATAGGEIRIPGIGKIDGINAELRITIEVHGDDFHGNPTKHPGNTKCHPYDRDITAGELFDATILRDQKIRDLGYNHIVIWEHDWKVFKKAGFVGELIGFDLEQLRDIMGYGK